MTLIMPVSTGSSTIGATGDYTTVAAWISAMAGTLTQPQVGELQDQVHAIGTGVSFAGITTSATNTITLRCSTGASFRDKAGAATNPLTPSSANGAILTSTSPYAIGITVPVDYVTLSGLQVDLSGGAQIGITIGGGSPTNLLIDSCIVRVETSAVTQVLKLNDATNVVKNSLIISNAAGGYGVYSAAAKVLDCTIARPSGFAAAGVGVYCVYGAMTVTGCAIFGFGTPTGTAGGSLAAGSDYNATDQASMGLSGGTNNLVSQPYTTSTFVAATGGDYRIVSGSALKDAGTTISGISADIIGTARPQGSAPDIGAWEVAAGGDTTPPTLASATVPTGGTTLTATLSESGCTPASGTGGFTLGGTSATVASWAISGTTLTLTLSGTVTSGQTVTLSYARAATTDDVADAAGNFLADFSAAAVTNNSTQTGGAPIPVFLHHYRQQGIS